MKPMSRVVGALAFVVVVGSIWGTPARGADVGGAALSPLGKALAEGGPARVIEACAGDGLEARFGRAAGKFLCAVERLCQRLHSMGAGSGGAAGSDRFRRTLPFLRMPVEPCAAPEEATPAKVGAMIGEFAVGMREVADDLEDLPSGEFASRVDLSTAWLDLDGDGRRGAGESVSGLFYALRGRGGGERDLVVRFDRADALWLRAYGNLLAGLAEVLLAYDWAPVWGECAHLLFARPTPMPRVAEVYPSLGSGGERFSERDVVDIIAAVHRMHLTCVDRGALGRAAGRLRATAASSAACLEAAAAEGDDECEWIPGARQRSVTGLSMGEDRAAIWKAMLSELDAALAGRRLVPFWRLAPIERGARGPVSEETRERLLAEFGGKPARGINLAKLIADPPPLDLVLLIQGSALVPYIEEGELMAPEVWRAVRGAFRGEFLGMLLFVN